MSESTPAQALETALAGFLATGAAHRNCAQAVMLYTLAALGEDPGVVALARYLGGGIGRSGSTCGALTGAALGLGLRDLHDPQTWADRSPEGCAQLQALLRDFRDEFGATECRALTDCDLSTEAGRMRFTNQRLRETRCVRYIEWVCGRLGELL
ncbi:MAG: C-GCAxxG-C-C family protein [Actinobacteria bacterium]|nr:C-GCAxxG-C-C family protein [Actinomycetota bacterium]